MEGQMVGFLKGDGSRLLQTVNGLAPGARYTLSYLVNARRSVISLRPNPEPPTQYQIFAGNETSPVFGLLPVGEGQPYFRNSFIFTAATIELVFSPYRHHPNQKNHSPSLHAMNDRDQLREDRLTRVQTFGRENAADFAAGSKGRTLLDRVDQHLLDLRDAKSGQTPARTSKATFLDALWLDFKDIARTARSIGAADLGGSTADYAVPEEFTEANIRTHADKLLRLLEDQPTDTAPQTAAKATLRGHFLAWEIASDFVEDLRADYDALIAANQHNQAENQEGVENTAAIGQILLAAGQDVENLNTIIRNKYSRQPEKLHTWQTASRIHRAPVRKKKAAPPQPPSGS